MTSARKIRANRANARASTGPQTTRGRARAARNALRHALSLPVCSIPALSDEVETLARDSEDLPAAQHAVLECARALGLGDVEPRSYLRMTLERSAAPSS